MGAHPFVKVVFGVLESEDLRQQVRSFIRTTHVYVCPNKHKVTASTPFCPQCGARTELHPQHERTLAPVHEVYGSLAIAMGGYADPDAPVVLGFVRAHVDAREDFGVFPLDVSEEDLREKLQVAFDALQRNVRPGAFDVRQARWHIVCGAH